MNPAYSVIFFTTLSGAGYGLLALLGLVAANHGVSSSPGFALATLSVSLSLITAGLLSSTLHLGHPERAWRALTQWRSSWLSREGILAVFSYPIAIVFGLQWSGAIILPNMLAPFAIATFVLSVLTIVCTAMIYKSLKTIPQWNQPLVVPVYLLFALAKGATVLAALASMFGRWQIFQGTLALVAIGALLVVKWIYWRTIDKIVPSMSTGKATGLGANVRQWEVPHTAVNFVQKEMGFAVARKHAARLRRIVYAALCLAMFFTVVSMAAYHGFAWLAAFAVVLCSFTERWLFFAEAKHVSSLYYGG